MTAAPSRHMMLLSSTLKKKNFVVIHRPSGQLGHFLELDALLSFFPENDTYSLVVLGDFNIHLETSQAADFNNLTASFDPKRVPTSATHKSDNELDLIYTHYCSSHPVAHIWSFSNHTWSCPNFSRHNTHFPTGYILVQPTYSLSLLLILCSLLPGPSP